MSTGVSEQRSPLLVAESVQKRYRNSFEGVAVGTLLGVLTTWLLARNSPAFETLDVAFPVAWAEISAAVGLAFVASFVATLVPARRAASVRPATAVRVAG
jgi:putative ABC transport system permease protein